MTISTRLDQLHARSINNRWLRYFAVLNRIALAAGFGPSGLVKITGERFTALSNNHPMGHYLEALYHTGYYYTFIGVLQVTAAILLLIPRTVVLGALIYFPIILNICILSFAVRFDGSFLSSPLMVLADLYLLCWNYDKLKLILPFNRPTAAEAVIDKRNISNKFPTAFFSGVAAVVIILILVIAKGFRIKPHNTLAECKVQCSTSHKPGACNTFCNDIHNAGRPLDSCLREYNRAPEEGTLPK